MSITGFDSPSGQYAFDILFLISVEESAMEINPFLSDDDIFPVSAPLSDGIKDVWTNVGTGKLISFRDSIAIMWIFLCSIPATTASTFRCFMSATCMKG